MRMLYCNSQYKVASCLSHPKTKMNSYKRRFHQTNNLGRWREWRGINQDVLAEQIGVSQATFSGYEKKDKLDQETLEKIAKALDIPVEAITEVDNNSSINIFSGTWNDNSVAQNYHPSFNPIDKIAELYERLLKSEQEKVAMLQEILRDK